MTTTTPALRGICSMATRGLMDDLARQHSRDAGVAVSFLATGGVDAARRVLDGEAFDVVVLASDAIDRLIGAGKAVPASRVDLVRSGVGVAVAADARPPDVSTGDALRDAVLAAARIGYSTGPSGVALIRLFERWGIADRVRDRLVQAPPGVPVGALLARGDVTLGFQQMSELIGIDGIRLLGPLPDEVQIETVFSAMPVLGSAHPAAVARLLDFMRSSDSVEAKRRHGMEPA
jgi:molybdate transport system substrate-binding protein